MSSRELFPIRRAAERERHLLIGDHPWASINDHKSLTFLLNEGSRLGVVAVAARDRLRRWAAYLRTHNFVTIHIPGSQNCFCDLLSRQGCVQAVEHWRGSPAMNAPAQARASGPSRILSKSAAASLQMAIIAPHKENQVTVLNRADEVHAF